jgi:hypothetical protein
MHTLLVFVLVLVLLVRNSSPFRVELSRIGITVVIILASVVVIAVRIVVGCLLWSGTGGGSGTGEWLETRLEVLPEKFLSVGNCLGVLHCSP